MAVNFDPAGHCPGGAALSENELSSLARKLESATRGTALSHTDRRGAGVTAVVERRTFPRAALCTLLASLLEGETVVPVPDPRALGRDEALPPPSTVLMSIGSRDMLDADVVEDLAAVGAVAPRAALVVVGDLDHAEQWSNAARQRVDAYIPSDNDPAILVQAIRLARYRRLADAGPEGEEAARLAPPPPLSVPNEAREAVPAIPRDATRQAEVRLTRREREVIACLGRGMQNKLIAHELDLCESTVKVHVRSILKKLNLSSRTQAALFARDLGLASFPSTARS